MRIAACAAIVVAVCAAFVGAEKLPIANAESLVTVLEPHALSLVFFSRTDRCPICPLLEAELESARDFIAAAHKTIPIIKVSCDSDNTLAIKYGIGTYPTLKLFANGREMSKPYRGRYSGIEIADYLIKSSEAPSEYLSTLAAAKEVVPGKDGSSLPAGSPIVIFGFFKLVNQDLNVLQDAERELRDTGFFRFVHASTDEVFNYYSVRSTFAIFSPHAVPGAPVPVFPATTNGLQIDQVLEFVAAHGLPPSAQLNGTNAFLYQRAARPILRVYADVVAEESKPALATYLDGLAAAAKAVPEVVFVVAALDYSTDGTTMDLAVLDYPTAAVDAGGAWALYHQGRKFRPEVDPAGFDVAAIEAFARGHLTAPLAPYLQSQPVPLDEKREPGVVDVVGRTFRHIVQDESKLVLVLLYAPWCGHCKELMPMWAQLGRMVAEAEQQEGAKGVVVAQIDATANELPRGYTPNGYPTVYAALPGQKSTPREYEGDRSIEAYIDFIERMLKEVRPSRD